MLPRDARRGYDGVALWAPYDGHEGPAGLKRLVDACHRHGLAVILDVVYNHLGPSGNYLGRFGPYFTSRCRTPWGDAVNLDGEGSDEVRRFVCDNALMWVRDYHMDGLRLDAVHAFVDTSARPLQNHDEIGNRTGGDRTSHLLSPPRLRVAAALVLTAPFIPLLFQGEEWGASTPFQYFVDHEDPVLAEAVREGRQQEFGAFGWRPEDVPDRQAIETYERSKLDWQESERGEHGSLLDWYHRLIALRLIVRRGSFTIAGNLAHAARSVALDPPLSSCWRRTLALSCGPARRRNCYRTAWRSFARPDDRPIVT